MVRLRESWRRLLGSLWFIPSIIVIGAIGLAIGMVELSTRIDGDSLARWPLLFGATADSSRAILSAIASGMITVAGLTFSLTVVAVTQASSQFTPRILRNFMSDRPNQMVLGTFVGIFAYCLVVLRTIRSVAERSFVPALAVFLGIVLAIVGIAVLIYFVHHIASTLQASNIVARVAHDTFGTIDVLFPDGIGDDADDGDGAGDGAGDAMYNASRIVMQRATEVDHWRAVPSARTGYVQGVDIDALVAAAGDAHGVIRMDCGPGDFVIAETPLVSVGGGTTQPGAMHQFDRRIARAYTIGKYRIVDEDVAFGLRQLVDISLRALSPGVNDTTTAVTCVDYIGAILVRLAPRRIDDPARETDGEVRVVVRGPTFESLLRLSVDEIRQNSGANVSVLARMMEMLIQVASYTASPRRLRLIMEQVVLLQEVAERTVPAVHDADRLRALSMRALSACA